MAGYNSGPLPSAPDVVIHFAAYARNMLVPDSELFQANVRSTYNVVEAASKLGVKKVRWQIDMSRVKTDRSRSSLRLAKPPTESVSPKEMSTTIPFPWKKTTMSTPRIPTLCQRFAVKRPRFVLRFLVESVFEKTDRYFAAHIRPSLQVGHLRTPHWQCD